jgi:transposase InsO family protein
MVFTTRLAGGRGGRNALEHELRSLGIKQENGKPSHPQAQGKAERFQQAMKNWLRAQPRQPATLVELQFQLGAFAGTCNTRRPHRSLEGPRNPGRRLHRPAQGRPRRPRADTRDRVRTGSIGAGSLSLSPSPPGSC